MLLSFSQETGGPVIYHMDGSNRTPHFHVCMYVIVLVHTFPNGQTPFAIIFHCYSLDHTVKENRLLIAAVAIVM